MPFNSCSDLPGSDPQALRRILGHSDRKGGVMVSLHWQSHWIGSHLRHSLLDVSLRMFPDTEEGNPTQNREAPSHG